MQDFSKETKLEIVRALASRDVKTSCPMCDNNNWAIAEGYFINPLQERPNVIHLAGAVIPTIVLICNKCGFVSQHALKVLGIEGEGSQNENQSE